jgi:hypothetical protein
MLPDGLTFIDSWVTADYTRCYHVTDCDDDGLLETWMDSWTDLTDFEVVPVVEGSEAAKIYDKGYTP